MRRKLVPQQNEDGSYSWVDPHGEPLPSHPDVFEPGRCLVRPSISEKHPHLSLNASCHSTQVKEFNDYYQELGIKGAMHLPDGRLESHSKTAFNRVLQARGIFNKDAGYGDWSGEASDPAPVDVQEQLRKDPELNQVVRYALRKMRSK